MRQLIVTQREFDQLIEDCVGLCLGCNWMGSAYHPDLEKQECRTCGRVEVAGVNWLNEHHLVEITEDDPNEFVAEGLE